MSEEKTCGEIKCGKVAGGWGAVGVAFGAAILVLGNSLTETSNKPYIFALFSLFNFLLILYNLLYPIDYNKECDDLSILDKIYFMTIGIKLTLSLGICISLLLYILG